MAMHILTDQQVKLLFFNGDHRSIYTQSSKRNGSTRNGLDLTSLQNNNPSFHI